MLLCAFSFIAAIDHRDDFFNPDEPDALGPETFEKWLCRGSKIFFAIDIISLNYD